MHAVNAHICWVLLWLSHCQASSIGVLTSQQSVHLLNLAFSLYLNVDTSYLLTSPTISRHIKAWCLIPNKSNKECGRVWTYPYIIISMLELQWIWGGYISFRSSSFPTFRPKMYCSYSPDKHLWVTWTLDLNYHFQLFPIMCFYISPP